VESNIGLNYAIVFVADMQRSVAFYRDVFGLPLRFESPEWTEFSTAGATLALHKAKGAGPVEAGAEISAAGRCRPGLSVDDLDEFHSRVVAKGATCVQAPKEVFGARIAQYLDPDGLAVSVSENRSGT
jgi:lactoylglutathione lyase